MLFMPVLDCPDHNTPDFKIVIGIDLDGFEVLVGKSTINASMLLPLQDACTSEH